MIIDNMKKRKNKKPKVLAISSGGGHWIQLLRLLPAFSEFDVAFSTVHSSHRIDVPGKRFYKIIDATRWNKFRLIIMLFMIFVVILKERPDAIVTTGAAPGYFAIRIGNLFGSKGCWLDSIANVEELSLSGQRVGPYCSLWLTQWKHLHINGKLQYKGSVFKIDD
ncbi:MAG: UDP-N-acetylglucosamine--LPS N-acetylglucosamine transferase [bacterium]